MSSVDHAQIYLRDPARYDALVAAEDCDGALPALLAELAPNLRGGRALEVGVGTGRCTRHLLRAGATVRGCEYAAPMLALAHERLRAEGFADDTFDLTVGDAYTLTYGEGWADVALAGWVFGHALRWHPDDWQARVTHALTAMRRALKPGGVLVVIETLGTGVEAPAPSPALDGFQRWLESAWGLRRRELRTDYRFASVDGAAEAMGFFFGEAMAAKVRDRGWRRVPECTGAWIG